MYCFVLGWSMRIRSATERYMMRYFLFDSRRDYHRAARCLWTTLLAADGDYSTMCEERCIAPSLPPSPAATAVVPPPAVEFCSWVLSATVSYIRDTDAARASRTLYYETALDTYSSALSRTRNLARSLHAACATHSHRLYITGHHALKSRLQNQNIYLLA
jgi:hypothetical protein